MFTTTIKWNPRNSLKTQHLRGRGALRLGLWRRPPRTVTADRKAITRWYCEQVWACIEQNIRIYNDLQALTPPDVVGSARVLSVIRADLAYYRKDLATLRWATVGGLKKAQGRPEEQLGEPVEGVPPSIGPVPYPQAYALAVVQSRRTYDDVLPDEPLTPA